MNKEWLKLREILLFNTPVDKFKSTYGSLIENYLEELESSPNKRREEIFTLLSEISVDLNSYLTNWHLIKTSNRDKPINKIIGLGTKKIFSIFERYNNSEKVNCIKEKIKEIKNSNLYKLTVMADKSLINNRWGNDASYGLTDALRKGAILVTTNPVMINSDRTMNPDNWKKFKENNKKDTPGLSSGELVRLKTIDIVLKNARELFPIFKASNEKYGYVSLQMNPNLYNDSIKMAEEVETIYEYITRSLNHKPNIIFKVPGTKAAIITAGRLTSKGIGVNITLSCSIDQHLAFAEVIEKGNAKLSFVVMMNGRLDDLVKEELLKQGCSEAEELSRWASTAVVKKSYKLLHKVNGFEKSNILVASLRGPWNIENLITDEKYPIFITVFPDKAKEYDEIEREIEPGIDKKIPDEILLKLKKSKIFLKAYNVGALTPDGFDDFYPVKKTLKQFIDSYDDSLDYMS
ncbi:transaldolase family protein [Actinomycetota bacterium]